MSRPEQVRCVRLGHGANCSSIGSVLDLLFATATVGAAIFAAAAASIPEATEPPRESDATTDTETAEQR